jgi:hypothetical protein
MTLVVAKKVLDSIVIVSDTKVTLERRSTVYNPDESLQLVKGKPDFEDSETLKTLILSPEICVAFAGNVRRAIDIIKRLVQTNQYTNITSLLNQLEKEISKDVTDDEKVEFIVGQIGKDSCDLYTINDGGIQSKIACWIGSQDAFHLYQRLLPRLDNDDIDEFKDYPSIYINAQLGSMILAMRYLIDVDEEDKKGKNQNDVGGLALAVKSTKNGFKYLVQSLNSHGPHSEVVTTSAGIRGGSVVDKNMIDAADIGGYTYSILTSRGAGQGCVGIYIYQNKTGMLYAPLLSTKRIRLKAADLEDFIGQASEKYGVTLEV